MLLLVISMYSKTTWLHNLFGIFNAERHSANEEFGGSSGKQLIGCFAVASRLNGVLQNDLEITALLHIHGALAFWDYSTAGPYGVINMNPEAIIYSRKRHNFVVSKYYI